MRAAVVMMTHRFEPSILDEFERMQSGLRAGDRAFILSDAATLPDTLRADVHRFRFDDIAGRARRLVGEGILHNVHLAWLDCFDRRPGFDHYWFIEYDVQFSGSWRTLFDAFREQPHDLFCAHLRNPDDEPDWHWWSEIHSPDGALERGRCLRGFLPIARLSRRAMQVLAASIASGWSGFLEGLIPTVLAHEGLRIGDFGGDGPFVPDGFRNRFYRSRSDREGGLRDVGTHRYRPAIAYPRIEPDLIYHPVKPESCVIDAGIDAEHAGAAIGNLLEQVRQIRERAGPSVPDLDALFQWLAGTDATNLRAAIARLQAAHRDDARFGRLRERLDRLEGPRA